MNSKPNFQPLRVRPAERMAAVFNPSTAGSFTLPATSYPPVMESENEHFFQGKKLLVVGGTSGMGLAVARMVLEAGGSVVLTGNKKDKAEAVQKELSPLGPVAVIAANLMTEEGMETIRQEINAHHRDISLMVNAAVSSCPKDLPSTALPIMTCIFR
jgi:short-subunit dehydrogenase